MSPEATAHPTTDTATDPIVVDIGRQRRKRVKQLRQGGGKLMDDVQAAIGELRRTGSISGTVQPVIVIVREKPRRMRGFMPGM